MRKPALIFCGGLALLTAVALRGQPQDNGPAQPAPAVRPAPLVGTSSCAGRSCHGSLTPLDRSSVLQNEFTTWVSRDPHATAYDALLNERSRAIAQRLGIKEAHRDERCLACHTHPAAAKEADGPLGRLLAEERRAGVGCEACHGGAAKWVDAHIDLASGWPKLSAKEKQARFGLAPVGDPFELAATCAGCHVGAPAKDGVPARDVNHDLIAAGHPRLAFELSAFLANLPPHWKPRPRDEGRTWAAGQIVSAEAALDLLDHRAAHGVWPELAEYDCFACHHGLTTDSWRRDADRLKGRKAGSLVWGSWYFALPRALGADERREDDRAFAALAEAMQRPQPASAKVRELIGPARERLQQIHGTAGRPVVAAARIRLLLDDPRLARAAGWDGTEQTYLALVALSQEAGREQLREELAGLADGRAFPPGTDGPRSVAPGFDPRAFFEKLRRLRP